MKDHMHRQLRIENMEDRRMLASTFEIAELLTTGLTIIEHEFATGDDRGGIAVSDSHVFYTGDGGTGRFSLENLSGGTGVGGQFDSMASNLQTGELYSLGVNATTPYSGFDFGGPGTITHLLRHNGATGSLSGSSVPLSAPVQVDFDTGIFAGGNRVLLLSTAGSTDTVYEIDLTPGSEGTVTNLGPLNNPQHRGCENWAYWGVAEHFGGEDYITYVQNSNTIVRTRVSDGATSPVASFPGGISDMCSITVSPETQRWYFHYEFFSDEFDFGNDENIGFADATILTRIQFGAIAPNPRTTAVDEIDVIFDSAIDPATFDFNDLVLTRDGGSNLVTSEVTVTSHSPTEFTISGLASLTTEDGDYVITVDASNISDAMGVSIEEQATTGWTVDSTFPPLSPVLPLGSLAYDGAEMRSVLSAPGDTQALTLDVEQGQTITVIASPDDQLRAAVELLDPDSNVVGSSTASAAGDSVLLQTLPAEASGAYTISLSAVDGTTGSFQLRVIINAAAEDEPLPGVDNDSIGAAQSLESTLIDLDAGSAERGAVIGSAGRSLYAVDRSSGALRRYDLATGEVQSSVDMTVRGRAVSEAYDLAVDPTSGEVYALVQFLGTSGAVATLDVDTGEVTMIGSVNASGNRFSDLAVGSDGSLYGVTGGQGLNPHSLFAIDKTNGATTLLTALPDPGGSSGEGLAFNPDDGLLYRFNGGVLQSIDPNNGYAVTTIPVIGPNPGRAQALTYASDGRFLLVENERVFSITTSGFVESLTNLSQASRIHGLALIGQDLVDYYSFTLEAGQTATLAAGAAGTTVELLAESGQLLAAGLPAANAGQIIQSFLAPADGTYYARVARESLGEYSLLIVKNADFDAESNDNPSLAQNLDASGAALGHVSAVARFLGADGPDGNLLLIDPANGSSAVLASNIGGGNGYNALAQSPTTGMLYGSQASGGSGLFAIDPSTYEETFIGNMGGQVRAMAWSPDGETLYAFQESTLGTIDPTTANFEPIVNADVPRVGGMAFQPGTQRLYFVSNQTPGLYVIDLGGDREVQLVGNPRQPLNSLEFLPDGRLLAGLTRNAVRPGFLVELDPDTAALDVIGRPLTDGSRNLTALEWLASTDDYYLVTAAEGDELQLTTHTPAGGPDELANLLDPTIELFDPTGASVGSDDNSAPDGRNAQLAHTATMAGTYVIRVSALEGTEGEYVLEATGMTGVAESSLTIDSSNPIDGQSVTLFQSLELNFSDALLLSSVDPSDLTVNGLPATDVRVVDGDTVSFDIAALQGEDGAYLVEVAAGVVQDLRGNPNEAFSMTLQLDATGPTVVSSTLLAGEVREPGNLAVTLGFSEPLDAQVLNQSDAFLQETLTGATRPADSLIYDEAAQEISMTFSEVTDGSYQLILLSGVNSVKDVSGNLLNGDPSFPLPSGEGDPEPGNFVIDFVVDTSVQPFPTPLEAVDPLGSLIYSGETIAVLAPVLDQDGYTIELKAGQTLSVMLQPESGDVQAGVTLLAPDGATLATSNAAAAGESALLQLAPVSEGGLYQLRVDSLAGQGTVRVRVLLNAAVEVDLPPASRGDFNGDDVVSVADYAIWRQTRGQMGVPPYSGADANGDGNITNEDYFIFRANFGGSSLPSQSIDASFIEVGDDSVQRGAVVGSVGRGLFTVDRSFGVLRQYDTTTGALQSSVQMTVGGGAVFAGYDLAVDPTNGALYGLVDYSGDQGALVVLDPVTGQGEAIASLNAANERFSDLAFGSDGSLYALTGNQGQNPHSLFAIDKTNGASTLLTELSDAGGGSGEGLAFNPDDGLLYRFDGGNFQSIDPDNGFAATNIPVTGANPGAGQSLAYAGDGRFVGSYFADLFSITASGVVQPLASLSQADRVHGLALIGDDLVDQYSFTLEAGQTATLLAGGAGTTVEVLDESGRLLAAGLPAENLGQIIHNFFAPFDGTYYARVARASLGEYSLSVIKNADFDAESNNDLSSAQDLNASGTVVGHVSSVPQLLGADGPDGNLLLIDPETGASTVVASNVGGGNGYNALARHPTTGVLYGSQAIGNTGFFEIDPETYSARLIGSMGGNVRAMAWTPYGDTLYGFRDTALGRVNLATGGFVTLAEMGDQFNGFIGGMAFHPTTSELYAVTNNSEGLYRISIEDRTATFIGSPGLGLNSLEFMPDGRLLAGVSRASGNSGYLVELDPLTGASTLIGPAVPSGNQNLSGLEFLSPTDDYYFVTAAEGDELLLSTKTPLDGPGEASNRLDPVIVLYGPTGAALATDDNSAVDGRNALLAHTASTGGTYVIRVSAVEGTQGEYVLEASGFSGGENPPLTIEASRPMDGQALTSLQTIELDFSNPLSFSSVNPTDLTVNGLPATGVQVLDSDTVSFDVAALQGEDGAYVVEVAAGVIQDLQGDPNEAFSMTLQLDATGPRVVASSLLAGDVIEPGDLAVTLGFSEPLDPRVLNRGDAVLQDMSSGETTPADSLAYNDATQEISATFAGVAEGSYQLILLSGVDAVKDVSGNLLSGDPSFPLPSGGGGSAAGDFVVDFVVDTSVLPFPTPLSALNPAGSLIYSGEVAAALAPALDEDAYTIELDAGQTLSVLLQPESGDLQAGVTVLDPDGQPWATATAGAAGEAALLQLAPASAGGLYRIQVESLAGEGIVQLQVLLNAAVEEEQVVGGDNNSIASAQPLDGSFIDLGLGAAQRGSARGLAGDADAADYYSFALTAGETVTLAATTAGTTVELVDDSGAALATGVPAANLSQVVHSFTALADGTYYARVARESHGEYRLAVLKNADFDAENNNDLASAQELSAGGVALGHVSSATAQLLGADGPGGNLLSVDLITAFSTELASNVGNRSGYSDLAYNPFSGVLYGAQASSDFDFSLFAIDPNTYVETLIGSTGGNVRALAWSPEGDVLYGFRDFTLGAIDPNTAAFEPLFEPDVGRVGGMAFRPETHELFVVTNSSPGLYQVSLEDGAVTEIGDLGQSFNSLEFLPDGRLLAGVSRAGLPSGYMYELDPETAELTSLGQVVSEGFQNVTALEWVSSDDDYYRWNVAAGTELRLATQTPAGGPGEFVNILDPSIELFDPAGNSVASDDNSAPDGRNAQLSYTALAGGEYVVRVSGAGGTRGAYVLQFGEQVDAQQISFVSLASTSASRRAETISSHQDEPDQLTLDLAIAEFGLVQDAAVDSFESDEELPLRNGQAYDETVADNVFQDFDGLRAYRPSIRPALSV